MVSQIAVKTAIIASDMTTCVNMCSRGSLIMGSYLHEHTLEIHSHDDELDKTALRETAV